MRLEQQCPPADLIVRYALGDLAPADRAVLEAHADHCGACRRAISELAAGSLTGRATAAVPSTAQGEEPAAGGTAPAAGESVSRYIVLHRVGAGGMGAVYAAYDPELDRKVALKVLHGAGESLRSRLLREARALARLRHPNVVTVHDVGVSAGRLFIAMEYVAGETLRQWVARRPRSWRAIRDVFAAAARGLEAAHAAGLVHRDFKPDNALVDRDGSVRVTDFGLAHAVESAEAGESDRGAELAEVAGTPAYMAPEQRRGEPADARSDQFSFCVALGEALSGQRPAIARALATAGAEAVGAVQSRVGLASAERGALGGAPRFVREAIERGLASEPADRHVSMTHLLEALTRDPRRRRRRRATAAIALAGLVALGWVGVARWAHTQTGPCAAAARAAEGVWGEDVRARVERAFAGTGRPAAATVFAGVDREIGRYLGRWSAMRTAACQATHVSREQSAHLLDLRSQCLDQRLSAVRALVSLFASSGEASLVDNAVQAAAGLPSLSLCADSKALLERVPPPADPADRATAALLRDRLEAVQALQRTGQYARGLEQARELLTEAEALAYPPTLAEALHLFGDLQYRVGDSETAEATLYRAARVAAEARDDDRAVRVWSLLAGVVGYVRGRPQEGLALIRAADAWAARATGDPALQAEVSDAHGLILDVSGHYDEARVHYQRALELREQLYGADHLEVAVSLNNLAGIPYEQGKFEEALQLHERALAIRERELGPTSPDVAVSVNAIAAVYADQGRLDLALPMYERALAIWRETLGDAHPDVAAAHNNLGNALRIRGDYRAAREHFDRALAIWRERLGEAHPFVSSAIANLGVACFKEGDTECAIDNFDRAIALREQTLGADHPSVADGLVNRGMVHQELQRFAEAEADFRRAVAIFTADGGAGDRRRARALNALGKCLLDSGRAKEALEPLEQAVQINLAPGTEAALTERVASQFALARALWEVGRERSRARDLAAAARSIATDPESAAIVSSWLAQRGGPR